VRDIADDLGLPVKLWPDTALIKKAEGGMARFLEREYERATPEAFACGEPERPSETMTLADYEGM
jgi:hypothetical protein